MKESQLRKGIVVTVYCDGPPSAQHERFVIVQYALTATLPIVTEDGEELGVRGMWHNLATWQYKGRAGRAQPVDLNLKAGKIVRLTKAEMLAIGRDPTEYQDYRAATVFACGRCGYREAIKGGGGTVFVALDTVAVSQLVGSGIDLQFSREAMLMALEATLGDNAGDEVEVRELVRRVRIIDATRD